MLTLLLGPILGVESDGDRLYYTCLIVAELAEPPVWKVDGHKVAFIALEKTATGTCWRSEWLSPRTVAKGRKVVYSILSGEAPLASAAQVPEWEFHLPGTKERPRFVYASCNGFSAAKLMAACERPYAMWERLATDHAKQPLGVLVLGGDQVYADSIWEKEWMGDFAKKSLQEMIAEKVSPEMEAQLDPFYEGLYVRQWGHPPVAVVLASVPSIMMWDDHDIFDGWGSHNDDLQDSDVYQRIYRSAVRAFRLFQLRGNRDRMFLEPKGGHFAYALTVRSETILMLDHRTERTKTQVMGAGQWTAFKAWLRDFKGTRLFVQSAVPVVYRTFGLIERVLGGTEKSEELEDDLLDHWTAREHQTERLRLVYTLLERMREICGKQDAKKAGCRWFFLSGDVHVGCMGSIWERGMDLGLYQVVASGIVHPPPTPLQWLGICAVSGDGEGRLANGDLETEIHEIAGARAKFLRTRNYARLEIDENGKVWVNWRCENGDETVFGV